MRLGALLVMRGDMEQGLRLMDEAVAANPDTKGVAADGCAAAAGILIKGGDFPRAVAALERARTFSPGDLRHRVALGGAREAAGDPVAALDEYRAVVAEVPESPQSSKRMDAILEKRGDKAARVQEWKRVAARHPEAALPQLYLGRALEAAGDAVGAEAAYRQALARDTKLNADSALFNSVKNAGRQGQ